MAPPSPLVVPVGGFLTLRWVVQGQPVVNVLGLFIQAGGVINQASADAIATVVHNQAVAANIAGKMSSANSLAQVGVRDLRTANQPEYLGAFAAIVGTDVAEPIPSSTACVVTLRTALAGKSFRGRVYLPMDGASAWDGLVRAYTALTTAAAVAFIDGIRSGLPGTVGYANIFGLAVVSRERAQANTVISVQSRNAINGTQRRRLPPRR